MKARYIAPELQGAFSADDLFAQVNRLEGEVIREIASRRTIKTRIGKATYFAKIHFGVGWREIVKNLFQGRLPVLGARNEWLALQKLNAAGIASMTPALYCETGVNPARRRSAILTRALDNTVSLEDFNTDSPRLKWQIITAVAMIARQMHRAGINHRDFYLCHFLMDRRADNEPSLHLIDLHRAQIRRKVPVRWLVKDLGGLLFSAFDKGLTRRDLLRFIRVYDGNLRRVRRRGGFWRKVVRRSRRLYLEDHARLPAHVIRLAP